MKDAINEVVKAIDIKEFSIDPVEEIRQAAHKISAIAIENYTDHLLKSALHVAGTIAQFANDLEGGDKASDT